MIKRGKLEALHRAYQIEERRALEEKARIDAVADARREAWTVAAERCQSLQREIERLRTEGRMAALQRGDIDQMAAVDGYQKRLNDSLDQLRQEAGLLEKELGRAMERVAEAEQEVLAARIERKKVERFLDSRARSARAVDTAVEEAADDEMNFFRLKK